MRKFLASILTVKELIDPAHSEAVSLMGHEWICEGCEATGFNRVGARWCPCCGRVIHSVPRQDWTTHDFLEHRDPH